jgi:hypothetical protein
MANEPKTIYLRHADGATHALTGRRLAKLAKAVKEGQGGPEVTALVEAGYTGFLGPDGETWDIDSLATLFVR